jgi:hypothetical protein
MKLETKMTSRKIFNGIGQVKGENFKRAYFSVVARRPDGKTRTISMAVIVGDEQLVKRLESEAQVGDQMEITTETRWDETTMPTYLLDFVRLERRREAA